ncbi:hypothetical protein SELMODRAFT_403436 [Selaginella moellendorffii]|uniref:Oleosin n=1 Tax=Selaginella moellendorffii TaxID=88036 RepID=D8QRE7_SELML|nr:oleosin 20.3 kDa [Selaginella moellendorffii]EFJ36766.1 hypothetical protein SELMODRAFT_403436 [Selaginella moellendorffii]|eukprot:XP_002961506.1 oleosin 20.3 kDa [Selaginella moellendorffii]
MADKMQSGERKLREHSPNARQVLGLVALLLGTVAVLTVGGFMLGGLALAVVIGIPVFLFFSPVLVPLGIVLFLAVSGIVITGAAILAFLSSVSWIYNYFKGRHPVGSDKIEAARQRLLGSVHQATEKAREYGSYAGGKAQEAAPGAAPGA